MRISHFAQNSQQICIAKFFYSLCISRKLHREKYQRENISLKNELKIRKDQSERPENMSHLCPSSNPPPLSETTFFVLLGFAHLEKEGSKFNILLGFLYTVELLLIVMQPVFDVDSPSDQDLWTLLLLFVKSRLYLDCSMNR